MALFGFSQVRAMLAAVEAVGGEGVRRDEMEKAVQRTYANVEGRYGHYQEGWAQLAAATQAERARLGYTPNDPLLRSGELRAAVTTEVAADGSEGIVGIQAGDPMAEVGVVQELGSLRGIPPRPIFGPVADEEGGAFVRSYGGRIKDAAQGQMP